MTAASSGPARYAISTLCCPLQMLMLLRHLIGKPDLVTLRVGPEKETFVLHKELLCARSEYFRAAHSGNFKEAGENEIALPEGVDMRAFRTFVTWLYVDQVEF
jgi:hypothetical protein